MIRGRFGNTSGRPYIEGRIFLPRIGVRGDISFLFDTGADESLLMPLDGLRMGIDYANLPDQASSSGIGGDYENFIEPAILIFAGDNEIYGYLLPSFRIGKPLPDAMTLPSILGRDVIDQWRVDYDKPQFRLTAEVITAGARQTLSGTTL